MHTYSFLHTAIKPQKKKNKQEVVLVLVEGIRNEPAAGSKTQTGQ